MATDVIMPALGVAQETGKVLRWLRSEGEEVAKGAPLMEIETDKVTVEVEAPATGTLAGVRVSEGSDVPVGDVVAVILAAGEEAPAEAPVAVAPDSAPPAPAEATGREDGGGRRPRRPLASPKARRIAAARRVDLAAVRGSGPRGAVLAADVEAPAAPPAAPGVGALWQRMAERTTQSWQSAPHFYLSRDVDAGRLETWRDNARRRPAYERLTHTDLLVKIAAAALVRHPRVNATWRDGEIVSNTEVNVGVAVAVEDGLIVPVIHHADKLELHEIVERRTALVESARSGSLRTDDVSGGTFTISNLGMFGVDAFAAILNAQQAAILAVGRIRDRIAPVNGRPDVRPMCTFTLSFDHRVVDGARGAQFLETLAELVEEPAGLVS
jgi:pyruvate dehydrogenase E2 component (dihydrolipoyllysine-residue acetyltransferase)